MADLSTWLTKAEAIATYRVADKTLVRWSKAGRLQQATRPQERGPDVVVYNPDDLQRIAQERRPGLAPFVLPADQDAHAGNGHDALAAADSTALMARAGDDVLQALLATALRAVMSGTSRTLPPFSTLEEAAAWLHLSKACVRRLVDDGTLTAIRDGRQLKVARRELEKLCDKV